MKNCHNATTYMCGIAIISTNDFDHVACINQPLSMDVKSLICDRSPLHFTPNVVPIIDIDENSKVRFVICIDLSCKSLML